MARQPNDRCVQCGIPIPPGQHTWRLKSDWHAGNYDETLCLECAQTYDTEITAAAPAASIEACEAQALRFRHFTIDTLPIHYPAFIAYGNGLSIGRYRALPDIERWTDGAAGGLGEDEL